MSQVHKGIVTSVEQLSAMVVGTTSVWTFGTVVVDFGAVAVVVVDFEADFGAVVAFEADFGAVVAFEVDFAAVIVDFAIGVDET